MYWWCSKCGVSAGNGVIQNITYRFSGVLSVGFPKVLSVRFAPNVNLVTFFPNDVLSVCPTLYIYLYISIYLYIYIYHQSYDPQLPFRASHGSAAGPWRDTPRPPASALATAPSCAWPWPPSAADARGSSPPQRRGPGCRGSKCLGKTLGRPWEGPGKAGGFQRLEEKSIEIHRNP